MTVAVGVAPDGCGIVRKAPDELFVQPSALGLPAAARDDLGEIAEDLRIVRPQLPPPAEQALGFAEPHTTLERLARYRQSNRFTRMSASGQSRLERLMPSLIQSAASQAKPDATLDCMLAIVESIGRRETYLALIKNRTFERVEEDTPTAQLE